jgi:hypothetical protein
MAIIKYNKYISIYNNNSLTIVPKKKFNNTPLQGDGLNMGTAVSHNLK